MKVHRGEQTHHGRETLSRLVSSTQNKKTSFEQRYGKIQVSLSVHTKPKGKVPLYERKSIGGSR